MINITQVTYVMARYRYFPLISKQCICGLVYPRNSSDFLKEVASKFLWPMDLFLTWHKVYLVSLILIFIILGAITMHYNAFLAVLFLRVVLYGPQNLVSFKKFPCTDGLGSTETVSDQLHCNTSDSI